MSDEEQQWTSLIARICSSAAFSTAKKRRELLLFLFQNRAAPLGDKEIEEEFFGSGITQTSFNPARARMALGEVRAKLEEYVVSAPEEKWRCELPNAMTRGGYQLIFTEVEKSLSASQAFWKPHLDSVEATILITGSHLFFFDSASDTILRFYGFNSMDGGGKRMLSDLKVVRPDLDTTTLEPWHNTYFAAGDIVAHEALLRWFYKEKHILLHRITSREITERTVHRHTPILIGRAQTNPYIARFMESNAAAKFGYRIHDVRGMVSVSNIRPEERRALSRFTVTEEGLVGPVTEAGFIFGIVTRMRNPGGYGYVTIIACDYYAMVIARIVEALTDDKHAQQLLNQMKWPANTPLPDCFEMLFCVTLSPGNLEGEGYPELIAWRPL